MEDLIRIGAAASALGVSVDTLRRWERDGRVTFERRSGQRFVAAEELTRLLTERAGEIVVSAQLSPQSHGPFEFDGRYVARFEQIAPEDPELDFGTQTPFVAMLDRKQQQEGAGSVRLFRAATRTGRRTVTLHGRWYLDVSFGDFPYAIRLTPIARR